MFGVDVDGDDNDGDNDNGDGDNGDGDDGGDDGGDDDDGDGHVELDLRTHPRLQVRGHRLEISSEIG